MADYPIPKMEQDRQASLDRLQILDTPSEERFDRITRLARRLLDVPIALVSLVDNDRQWFKSVQGLNVTETTRNVSFCAHAIMNPESIMVVPDATKDQRFLNNPLVTDEPQIRFYAGHPLKSTDSQPLGTLCIIDRKPREITPEESAILHDLAGIVESELHIFRLSESQKDLVTKLDKAQKTAMVDSLTKLWNREAFFDVFNREIERARRDKLPISVAMIDLDHFKSVNDTYGHPAGDEVLKTAADRLRSSVRPYDAVGRYGGEEFIILWIECDRDSASLLARRILEHMTSSPIPIPEGKLNVTCSIGVTSVEPGSALDAAKIVDEADKALYRAKSNGRNRFEITYIGNP